MQRERHFFFHLALHLLHLGLHLLHVEVDPLAILGTGCRPYSVDVEEEEGEEEEEGKRGKEEGGWGGGRVGGWEKGRSHEYHSHRIAMSL